MAEQKKGPPPAARAIVLLIVLGTIGYFVWKSATNHEDYTGGDVTTTGTIEAIHIDLAYKVGGRIAEVFVTEGADVVAGQLVGRIDPEDLDVQVGSAKASLEAARASLARARADRDKARRDLDRQRELLAADATTKQQLEAAESAADVTNALVRQAEAQIRQAESALAQATLQRSYAELRAPSGGEVSDVTRRPGEFVTPGMPVLTLAELDTLKVRAAVDETRVGAVRPGDHVQVRVYTFDDKVFEGVVTDVRPAGDFATRKDWGAERRDIRTFTVTARMPNTEHLLKEGMTAEVRIKVSPEVQQAARGGAAPGEPAGGKP